MLAFCLHLQGWRKMQYVVSKRRYLSRIEYCSDTRSIGYTIWKRSILLIVPRTGWCIGDAVKLVFQRKTVRISAGLQDTVTEVYVVFLSISRRTLVHFLHKSHELVIPNIFLLSEISRSQGNIYKDDNLLGYSAMYTR
jgi:hypothetical protein